MLAERLRELDRGGIVRRRSCPPPFAASVYELTEWGRELEPIVTALGAWGAGSPFPPDERAIGADSIVLALRSLFDPEAAGEMVATYELRLGENVFHVDIADWESRCTAGRRRGQRRRSRPTRRRWPRSSPGSCRSTARSRTERCRSRDARARSVDSSVRSRCRRPARSHPSGNGRGGNRGMSSKPTARL